MKKILIMILAVVAAMGLNAQSAFFKGCEDMPGVSTVYISKAMLELAGASNITGGDFDIGGIASKLDGLEIVSAEGSGLAKLKGKCGAFSSGKGYEKLMRVKNDGSNVSILMKKLGGGRNEFVVFVDEETSLVVIMMTGTMTMQDVINAAK